MKMYVCKSITVISNITLLSKDSENVFVTHSAVVVVIISIILKMKLPALLS